MDLATLQRMHPQWNLVDFKVAPNGGLWALGSDGGLFALDAGGGTSGVTAPFYGSYTQLPADQRQGARTFTRLDTTPSGGYVLVSANQELYGVGGEFGPRPQAPTPAPAVNTTNTQQATTLQTGPDLSAEAALHSVLDPLGLGSLAGQALNFLRSTPGATADYVTQVWLPQQQSYKDMFPEIGMAQQKVAADPSKGTYVPTPADILNYRNQAQQYVQQGLIPPEFASKDNLAKLIVGGTSVDEFRSRIEGGWAKLVQAPDDLAAFLEYHPGLDMQHAVGVLLDPALGDEAANAAIGQAQIGGAARRSGFGAVTAGEAAMLQQAGQGTQAQFAQAAEQSALTQELVGEGEDLTRGTQVAAIGQNAEAQQALARRRAGRGALFEGGGGAGGGGTGKTGLG